MNYKNDNHRTFTTRERREFLNWVNCWQYMILDRLGPPPANKQPLRLWLVERPVRCAIVGLWYPVCSYVRPI